MKKLLLTIFMVLTLFLGCEKEGLDGKNSLLDLIVEPAGDNCSSGGYKIISGIDLNNDNTLDENEIQNTEYVCNGDAGSNGTLLNVIPEPVGDNCSSGGYKIISGIDIDVNDTLDNSEIQNIEYVCNGDDGGYDKTILINFPANGYANGTSSSAGIIIDMQIIRNFNISDYVDADSIVFGVYLQSTSTNTNCIIELYDRTNNKVINNTLLTSNASEWDWNITSINFITDLPNGSFDMGIRLKSETEGTNVSCYLPILMIYRK